MDCFAEPVIGPRFARTRWLAMTGCTSRRQRLHFLVEIGLPFKADARQIRHRDVPVFDTHTVRKTTIGLEQIGIAFIATKPEAGGDVERHLMAAMRDAAVGLPA